jgi:hypothetical protein
LLAEDLVNFDQDEAFFMEDDDYQRGRSVPVPGDYRGKILPLLIEARNGLLAIVDDAYSY